MGKVAAALKRFVERSSGPQGRVVILVGQDFGQLSGLPDFSSRGGGGWVIGDSEYHPAALATKNSFRRMWWAVWSWYAWRAGCCMTVQPSPAHWAVGDLCRLLPGRVQVVSLATDGLLRATVPENVLTERRGNVTTMRCDHPQHPHPEREFPLPDELPGLPKGGWRAYANPSRFRLSQDVSNLLKCPLCLHGARPNELWYDEGSDTASAGSAAVVGALARKCDLLISCGDTDADPCSVLTAKTLVEAVRARNGEVVFTCGSTDDSYSATDPTNAVGHLGVRSLKPDRFEHPLPAVARGARGAQRCGQVFDAFDEFSEAVDVTETLLREQG
eukprot:Hpha_TRINITY_DN31106_c0_g1::TRINITY_DN31106_c0_g1_i1::g.32949::m.32949/K12410/npdA; NAD-dependent deacetylase